MSYTEKPSCDICNAPGQDLYSGLPDITFHTDATASLNRCSNRACGTVWTNPFPDPQTIAGFYASYYTHSTPAPRYAPGHQSPTFAARLRHLIRRVLRLISGGSARFGSDLRYLGECPPGRVLDVGCGNGDFLAEAAARGWRVFGQEFDAKAAEIARQVSGAEVRVKDLLDAGYEADSFDAVTLSNVLEHLPNPHEILEEARRVLKPGGRLVSISPNPQSYLHRKYHMFWRGLEVPRHLFLLPPRALKRLCRDVGYARVETFSTPGAFRAMETASAELRALNAPDLAPLPVTSKGQLLRIYAATLLGRDIGEWSVVVAQK